MRQPLIKKDNIAKCINAQIGFMGFSPLSNAVGGFAVLSIIS